LFSKGQVPLFLFGSSKLRLPKVYLEAFEQKDFFTVDRLSNALSNGMFLESKFNV
jgi:hypothetical protein